MRTRVRIGGGVLVSAVVLRLLAVGQGGFRRYFRPKPTSVEFDNGFALHDFDYEMTD